MVDGEIADVRQVRHEISEECGHDVHKVAVYYREAGQKLRESAEFRTNSSLKAAETPPTAMTVGMGPEILDWMELAVAKVRERLLRATDALNRAGIPYAVIGGNAVAYWVRTVDEGAVRNTRDVDMLVRHADLPGILTALQTAGFDYLEDGFAGVLVDRFEKKPRIAIHLIYCGRKYRPDNVLPAPEIDTIDDPAGFRVQKLGSLVEMKLVANRTIDKVHLRDLTDVGLLGASWLTNLPPKLAERLKHILDTPDG